MPGAAASRLTIPLAEVTEWLRHVVVSQPLSRPRVVALAPQGVDLRRGENGEVISANLDDAQVRQVEVLPAVQCGVGVGVDLPPGLMT